MKKFIVFGLGISGKAAIKYLLTNGFEVLAGDDNQSSITNLYQYLPDKLGNKLWQATKNNLTIIQNINQINWANFDYLILAAGIPLNYPQPHPIAAAALANKCQIICDVEALYLFNPQAKFIGITGTNGKSTTTALINHIFNCCQQKSATGGNIGVGALELPNLGLNSAYIIEMSSYQLDLIKQTRFNFALLLNITPDHIERHQDFAGYIKAKKQIFANQKAGDFALINVDDQGSVMVFNQLKNDPNFKGKLIAISTKEIFSGGLTIIDHKIYNNLNQENQLIDLGEQRFLKGEHNSQNIAFAFAACFLFGLNPEKIVNAIKSFKGLKHRMQQVANIGKINFINDSKATNAKSSENALKCYDNIYWILGGVAKEGGIDGLQPYFSKIKAAFLIGQASENFAQTFNQAAEQNPENKVNYFKCETLEKAFELAYQMANLQARINNSNINQLNVLLSPACASFDQWQNFEKRGDFFCQLVEERLKSLI